MPRAFPLVAFLKKGPGNDVGDAGYATGNKKCLMNSYIVAMSKHK